MFEPLLITLIPVDLPGFRLRIRNVHATMVPDCGHNCSILNIVFSRNQQYYFVFLFCQAKLYRFCLVFIASIKREKTAKKNTNPAILKITKVENIALSNRRRLRILAVHVLPSAGWRI